MRGCNARQRKTGASITHLCSLLPLPLAPLESVGAMLTPGGELPAAGLPNRQHGPLEPAKSQHWRTRKARAGMQPERSCSGAWLAVSVVVVPPSKPGDGAPAARLESLWPAETLEMYAHIAASMAANSSHHAGPFPTIISEDRRDVSVIADRIQSQIHDPDSGGGRKSMPWGARTGRGLSHHKP